MTAERFVVIALGWDGTCVERHGGFYSRREARPTAEQLFARSDVSVVMVRPEEAQPARRTYR